MFRASMQQSSLAALMVSFVLDPSCKACPRRPPKRAGEKHSRVVCRCDCARRISFKAVASHTPQKYLLETMGSSVALFAGYDEWRPPAHILENETATETHWLSIALTGQRSDRDAIGAEMEVPTAHGEQLMAVSTAGSYLSSNDEAAHFGLGPDKIVRTDRDTLASGVRQHLENVRADQFLKVDEPSEPLPVRPAKAP
jgi:hypothetical protein